MLLQAQERYGHAGTGRVALGESLVENDGLIEKSADLGRSPVDDRRLEALPASA
jgi:hypothetical protein